MAVGRLGGEDGVMGDQIVDEPRTDVVRDEGDDRASRLSGLWAKGRQGRKKK